MPVFQPTIFRQSVFRPKGVFGLTFNNATFNWDFTRGNMPKNITFTRASSATDFNDPALTYGTNVPVLNSNGWLIQGARTNLMLRSADFTDAAWVKLNATVTANQALAPDGTMTADAIRASDLLSNEKRLDQDATTSSNAVAIGSIFVKAANRTWCAVTTLTTEDSKGVRRYVNLSNGAIGSTNDFNAPASPSFSVQSVGNGWYRISAGMTGVGGVVSTSLRVQPASGDGGRVYAAASTSTDEIYVWGGQLEQGASFASSYIPTAGTTATRADDVQTISNLSTIGFNALGVTIVGRVKYNGLAPSGGNRIIEFGANSSNRMGLDISSSAVKVFSVSGGTVQALFGTRTVTAGTTFGFASSFTANMFRLSVNGLAVESDIVGLLPASFTECRIGRGFTDALRLEGYLQRLTLFPTASLSDAQLQALSAV